MAESHDADPAGRGTLGVRGYACQIFDDPELTWALHRETHLIAWRGEVNGNLRVDRYDARNLLEDRSQFRQLKKRKRAGSGNGDDKDDIGNVSTGEEAQETEKQLLHRLRYGDYSMEFPPTEEDSFSAENKFPYAYPEDESDAESDGEAFEPQWAVPKHLTLPKTRKSHEILQATANKVRGNPQLEVMLKVKLGGNVKFRFLDASHALHGYYCFLRDSNPQRPKKNTGSVSLLGEEYEDSDVEEENDASRPLRKKQCG